MDVTPKASSVVSDALPLYFGLLRISSRDCILRGLETWSDITAQVGLTSCMSGFLRMLLDYR